MKTQTTVRFFSLLFTIAITAEIAFAADSSSKASVTNQFVAGAKGEVLLRKLYTNNFDSVRLSPVLEKWRQLVSEAGQKTNITVTSIAFVDALPPKRAFVIECFGKPEATTKNEIPGLKYSDGTPITKPFLWFGCLGLSFFGGESDSDGHMIAIAYDPKRDKP